MIMSVCTITMVTAIQQAMEYNRKKSKKIQISKVCSKAAVARAAEQKNTAAGVKERIGFDTYIQAHRNRTHENTGKQTTRE